MPMTLPDYEDYDAVDLAGLVAKGEVSAEELLRAAVERMEQRNPIVNAVVHHWVDEAFARIAEGLPDGPFRGVPYLLKDLYAPYSGQPMTNGCRFFDGAVARADSTLVSRLRQAGLVIFGTTNSSELGLHISTEPQAFGPTRNPWLTSHSAGGSSGGAAAAVAAGILPAAYASDGGGSIRIPAACCGLFGLKPSRGRNPIGPVVGEGWAGLAVQHAVTRSVRDSAALLDATHGPEPGDPYAAPPLARPLLQEVGAAPGRLKLALVRQAPPSDPDIEPACVAAVDDAAMLCQSLGHEIEEVQLPVDWQALTEAVRVIIAANLKNDIAARVGEIGRHPEPSELEHGTQVFLSEAERFSAADYAAAVFQVHHCGRRIGQFLSDFDAILSPTITRKPWPLGDIDTLSGDIDALTERVVPVIRFTSLFNITGGPAASLPLFWDNGLPIGVQIASRLGEEALLVRLSSQLEAACPWHLRRPTGSYPAT